MLRKSAQAIRPHLDLYLGFLSGDIQYLMSRRRQIMTDLQ